MDFKEFLRSNCLKQVDIAKYLNVTEASVSRMTNGVTSPSKANLRKLLSNPYGWDTSALTGSTITARASGNSSASVNIGSGESMPALLKEIELLREQLAEEKQRSAQYWEMIQKLMK